MTYVENKRTLNTMVVEMLQCTSVKLAYCHMLQGSLEYFTLLLYSSELLVSSSELLVTDPSACTNKTYFHLDCGVNTHNSSN